MSSPMKRPGLHDTFVLLHGAKRRPLPGVARVTVTMSANQDVQTPPGSETAVTSLNQAKADISVQLTMWKAEQWEAYQSILQVLRAGDSDFTSAHPELRARRVKRFYFVSEQSEAYSPSTGYRVTVRFSEKIKTPAPVKPVNNNDVDKGVGVNSNAPDPGRATGTATTVIGQKIRDNAIRVLTQTPAPKTRDGVHDVSEGGYCSSFARVIGTAAGLPDALFGPTAGGTVQGTEARFKAAHMLVPWSSSTQSGLEIGDMLFWPDPPGAGHVGIFMGYAANGTALIASNSYVTYKDRGGQPDSSGRPTGRDAQGRPVDARGILPITAFGQPTSVGKPYRVDGIKAGPALPPVKAGPPVPLPVDRPSLHIPKPPSAALTPYEQVKAIIKKP